MTEQPQLPFGVPEIDRVDESRLREFAAHAQVRAEDHPRRDLGSCRRNSQCARILALLEGGEWVPAYKLADVALQYNARIWQLRRRGYQIENRTEEVDGVVHSAYRLATVLVAT